MIDRAFVRLEEGLVHYRCRLETDSEQTLPLYMVHAGPVSSASLAPMIEGFKSSRNIYAPDTLGYGDSAPPAPANPDVQYYADSVVRVLDALNLDQIDFFGTHTGAHIGCELAINHPDRVRRLVFDGMGLFDEQLRKELLENYAPAKEPDEYGTQFHWAWQFLRDQALYFPYFKRDAEHRLEMSMLPPDMLHDFVVEVLKSLRTYHKGYNAVFRHDVAARLPHIQHPVLFLGAEGGPLASSLEEVASLTPNGRAKAMPHLADPAISIGIIEEFLDS